VNERDTFVQGRQAAWERLDALLARPRLVRASEWAELAALYRRVCADLARAQSLGLADDVVSYLDRLASRSHNRLYRRSGGLLGRLARTVLEEFPRTARAEWRFVLAAHLLFYVPFAIGLAGPQLSPDFAGGVLPEPALIEVERMYERLIGRETGEDALMAGFYVWNNVGIALRCFATGLFAGLGSAFYLVYNGLILGTISGYLVQRGLGWNLLDFTAGHSAWELTGIAVSGAAGLKLGAALIVTQGRTRAASLRAAGPAIYRLVLGSAALLLVAAAIEGFWSAGPLPTPVKIAFGAAGALVVLGWLLAGGRSSGAQ
jgi:uncharacterized membrane protein SpoIIM required for sporulation